MIISSSDVTIESGAGLLVIAAGKIRFTQSPEREWGGVFVAKGTFVAPWVARAVVHARGGAEVRSNSVDLVAYDTLLRAGPATNFENRTGAPLFSDSPARAAKPRPVEPRPVSPPSNARFQFAGERCQPAVPEEEIAARVPAMAREKSNCADVDLIIANCKRAVAGGVDEEIWTVHTCMNQLVEIRARRVGGASQFDFPPIPGVAILAPKRVEGPSSCAPDDHACLFARSYPLPPVAAACPTLRAKADDVDQLQRVIGKSGSRNAISGPQVATYFESIHDALISRLEWSGLVQYAEAEERFLIRVYRDENGEPRTLVHEMGVVARRLALSPVRTAFRDPDHSVLFTAEFPAIKLLAGPYWLSIIDPKISRMEFVWNFERDAGGGVCGSGGTMRRGEAEPWLHMNPSVPHRSARGYSFRLVLARPNSEQGRSKSGQQKGSETKGQEKTRQR